MSFSPPSKDIMDQTTEETTRVTVRKLCDELSTRAVLDQEAMQYTRIAALQQLKQQHVSTAPGLLPSGPRKQGEGCDDENQGIIAAEETNTGGALLRVTLLAAGFLIGPGGSSIRGVSQKTGAEIRSWSESARALGKDRRVRTIVVEGQSPAVMEALAVLIEAVERYKELCEGKYCGQAVDRVQNIRGVEFFYSPPPRSAVPFAAGLKPETSVTTSNPIAGHNLMTSGKVIVVPVGSLASSQKENLVASRPVHGHASSRGTAQKPTTPKTQPFPLMPSSHVTHYSHDIGVLGEHHRGTSQSAGFQHTGAGISQYGVPMGMVQPVISAPSTPMIMNMTPVGPFNPNAYVQQPFVQWSSQAGPELSPAELVNRELTSDQNIVPHNTPSYSLFGNDRNMVGPELLRHIWNENTPEANAPTDHSYNGTVHTGWRSNFSVPIQTDNWMIGVPRYADYAVKSPYCYGPPSLFAGVDAYNACDLPKCGATIPNFQGTLERTDNGNMRSAFEETSEMILREINEMVD